MKVRLFNTEVQLNDDYCQLNSLEPLAVTEPYINLYVQSKGCNARCGFCEYQNIGNQFNLKKFENFLKQLSSEIKVRKISFTGGEPTLSYSNFHLRLEVAREYLPESFFVVNTNGLNLKKLIASDDYLLLDSIALSRHAVSDEDNRSILGFNAPSENDLLSAIQSVENKELFHFSCNIIKNYVDSESKVLEYLEWCSCLGITDVGFVSLMAVNDFAKEHFVDFDSFNFEGNERLVKTKIWNRKDSCRCNNYLYIPYNCENVVKVYNRYVYSKSGANNFVFDGEYFRKGFGGEIIY